MNSIPDKLTETYGVNRLYSLSVVGLNVVALSKD